MFLARKDEDEDLKEMRILAMRLAFLALKFAYKHYTKKKSKRKASVWKPTADPRV